MPFHILLLVPLVLLLAPVASHADTDYGHGGGFGNADSTITPGMQRDHGRDFLRPEFEHERQRGFGDDESWRRSDGLQRGMDRADPRADPGFERAWEGLESDRGRRDGPGSRY